MDPRQANFNPFIVSPHPIITDSLTKSQELPQGNYYPNSPKIIASPHMYPSNYIQGNVIYPSSPSKFVFANIPHHQEMNFTLEPSHDEVYYKKPINYENDFKKIEDDLVIIPEQKKNNEGFKSLDHGK